jgi:hypothetical protein
MSDSAFVAAALEVIMLIRASSLVSLLSLSLAGCAGTSSADGAEASVTPTPPERPVVATTTSSDPAPTGAAREIVIPPGSADYSRMLGLAVAFKKGQLTFDALKAKVVAEKLPPHGLGCGYLMMVPPPPPPGIVFEPGLMPRDWVGTFGEVAMTHFAGALSREEYEALHQAAHGTLPGFPNCRP